MRRGHLARNLRSVTALSGVRLGVMWPHACIGSGRYRTGILNSCMSAVGRSETVNTESPGKGRFLTHCRLS
jgi:hypothetical protein